MLRLGSNGWLGLIVLVSMLAGCADPGGTAAGPTASEGGGAGVAPGKIVGNVVDTEFAPIADATVTATPGGRLATTDPAGKFTIAGLELGSYSLKAEKKGYAGKGVTIDVTDDEEKKVVLQLEIVPSGVPTHDTESFGGHILCQASTDRPLNYASAPCSAFVSDLNGDLGVGDKTRFHFKIDKMGFRELIIEAKWNEQNLGHDAQYTILEPDKPPSQAKSYATGKSAPPLWERVAAGQKAGDDVFYPIPDAEQRYQLRVIGDRGNNTVPIALFLDWRFDAFVTKFYNGLAPAGFAIVPKD